MKLSVGEIPLNGSADCPCLTGNDIVYSLTNIRKRRV
nr:MAG TPA: hypothetical protein [Caudoviricetes sp.]